MACGAFPRDNRSERLRQELGVRAASIIVGEDRVRRRSGVRWNRPQQTDGGKPWLQADEGASVERIGFVGLGTMGASMAANLARAGAPLTVWNRTPGRAAAVIGLGAQEAGTPARLAARSDVVVICVSDTPDVEAVLFGPDGIAAGVTSIATTRMMVIRRLR